MSAALLGFAVVLALAFLGVPLCFAMLSVGVGLFAALRGLHPALMMAGQTISDLATNEGLSVLPMFILMGALIYKSELADELYDAAYALVGHKRGGLAYATVLASAGFASISGSSIATAATMTKVAMPSMRRLHYDDSLASGCVSSAGTLGALVPPSVPLLIYGIVTQQDIAKLFVAGILPGLLLGTLFMVSIWWTVSRNPALGPAGPQLGWPERLRRISKVWPIVLLFLIVMGGLYSGVFTANEAGGVGAAGATLFAAARGKLRWSVLVDSLCEAGRTTAMIFAVAFGGMVFANFVTLSGLTSALVALVGGLHLPVTGLIVVIMLVYVVLGSMMEAISMMLLTVPVFAAVLGPLGVSMLWFGVFVAMMIEIGMIHPPIGMNVFMVKTMMPELSTRTIFAGTIPFLVANFVALGLIIAFPMLATWLPTFAR
ncbi:TRAP transporter large permease [Thiomonas sp. FB-6]|uniref:TRAP transporter large permease n=1 Tax=Thiomonas sp. FB-6 TaxID=1158291 RepID=UPI00037D2B03|nr:TRAP transporter large permease [Thiomonas sp. FB-6]